MKKPHLWLYLVLAIALLATSCKKKSSPEPNDDPELPPKTQTGADTFGCRINGVPWIPKGIPFSVSRLVASYDSNFLNGTLNITARRRLSTSSETIILFSDSLKTIGTYPLTIPKKQGAEYINWDNGNCSFHARDIYERVGTMTLTKLDIRNNIVSGTFEFTLKRPECTITATNGRFDIKL